MVRHVDFQKRIGKKEGRKQGKKSAAAYAFETNPNPVPCSFGALGFEFT